MTEEDTVVEIAGQRYRLNGVQQIMDEEGQNVAVAVSYGYGAGWSSWGSILATDPIVIRALLEGRELTHEERATLGENYMGGFEGLTVEWHPAGTWIAIHEYDGAESCVHAVEGEGEYLHPSSERLREAERAQHALACRERRATRWDAIAEAMYADVLTRTVDGRTMILQVQTENDEESLYSIHESVAKTVPYYRTLLESGFLESASRTSTLLVRVLGSGAYLVEFMYRGALAKDLDEEERKELREVADMLQFDDLGRYLD